MQSRMNFFLCSTMVSIPHAGSARGTRSTGKSCVVLGRSVTVRHAGDWNHFFMFLSIAIKFLGCSIVGGAI